MASRSSSGPALQAVDHLLASGELQRGRRQSESNRPDPPGTQLPDRQRRSARTGKTRLQVVTIPAFSRIDWLLHGFSTRTGGKTTVYRPEQRAGELNLGFTSSDDPAHVATNRQRFFSAVTADPGFPAVTLRQIHSSFVLRVGRADASAQAVYKADGMMTDEPGVLLAIQTADCIPVLIADTRKRAVAGFHAGWRGTVKRIVESGVGRMRMEFGSRPEDLIAAIGPGIGQCCYAVGEDVRGEFESQFAYASELFREVYDSDPVKEKYPLLFLTARAPGHSNLGPGLHLDLVEANRRQLLDAGLKAEAISIVGECTSCRTDRYFSYRAEQGSTGRMFSAIAIRP
jgi:YfiH family protein